jgi:hypothetical protein
MFDDPDGLDVDAAWGPYATRDAIKRGDWRKIERLRYDSYAEAKFLDLERLYNGYDSRNWFTRNVWDAQGASQQLGSIANREADLNRIIKEGPWAVKHDEVTKAHTLKVAVETYLPALAAAASAPSAVQGAFANANATINASLEFAQISAQSARSAMSLKLGQVTVPQGFAHGLEYNTFSKTLNAGLAEAGYSGTEAFFQGSSVTGKSFRTGEAFDVGRVSDFDIALTGPKIMKAAVDAGIPLRSGGTRTGPLTAADLQKLGLSSLAGQLSDDASRPVNFMIFESAEAATQRAPSIPVMK